MEMGLESFLGTGKAGKLYIHELVSRQPALGWLETNFMHTFPVQRVVAENNEFTSVFLSRELSSHTTSYFVSAVCRAVRQISSSQSAS